MTERPLVSILFPTRGRHQILGSAVDSLYSLAHNPSRLEFLFKCDDDDPDTIEWCRWMQKSVPNVPVRVFTGPRGNGYADMHLWINGLARNATGEWLIIWNDDAHMATQSWDAILASVRMNDTGWHGVHEVRCLVIDTEVTSSNAFFFLRREVVELLGRFSYIPHCDTWVVTLMKMVDSLIDLKQIKVRHHTGINDLVRQEARPVLETTKYTTDSVDGTITKLRDAIKLQTFIDSKKVKPVRLSAAKFSKYTITDADTCALIWAFDEPEGGRVLEVGAHDEPIANLLTDCGYMVTGVDLREYNAGEDRGFKVANLSPKCNYAYVRGDFCDLPRWFMMDYWREFDCAISLSALEHFGLGTYGEGPPHPYYDVIAMRTAWNLLRDGGVAYITVPFGGRHLDNGTHWRVYDDASLKARLIQDFTVELEVYFAATDLDVAGRVRPAGEFVSKQDAMTFSGHPPHLSVLLKLRKKPVKRLAPDGR